MTTPDHNTETGLPAAYDEAAMPPAPLSGTMTLPTCTAIAPEPSDLDSLVHAVNVLDERVKRGVSAVRRQMCITYSAAVAAGKMLTEFKASHPRDYGKYFAGGSRGNIGEHRLFTFTQQTGARYCRYYREAWSEALHAGCTDEMEQQLSSYLKGGMDAAPLAAAMMERAKTAQRNLQELGALPAPPAPSLGDKLDGAAKQGELALTWEERHTRAWTKWGGIDEQLETYFETSAAILTKTDREAAASRLEEMARRLRAMPATPAPGLPLA